MKRYERAVDIARRLGVSTSILRHYEAWGLIPPVPRSATGYRLYGEEHAAYLECIRAMVPGFGLKATGDIVKQVQRGNVTEALWRLNASYAALHREKEWMERIVEMLDALDQNDIRTVESEQEGKRFWDIGEAELQTGVPASAIRYWEKLGLIAPPRNKANGYRVFDSEHIRQILLIRMMRQSDYPLGAIRQVMREIDLRNAAQAVHIAREALRKLDGKIREQLRGAASLYRLCRMLRLIDIVEGD